MYSIYGLMCMLEIDFSYRVNTMTKLVSFDYKT